MAMQKYLLISLVLLKTVLGDVYLHSIRGANNRLDEANRERNNGNRLYDTQNNDRGGYNVGKLHFYEGEQVPISWTLQHGCGTDDTKHCEVVLQAMCDKPGERIIRDGTTTQRIPDNPTNCRNFNCDTDMKYGRHESYNWYQTCKYTKRNTQLFTASQNLNRGDATRTRQNPGGTRRGYECPEERDYYPYWRPTEWIDLAIWTKDTDKCQEYIAESENVKSRWYCNVPEEVMLSNYGENRNNWIARIPITQEACEEMHSVDTQGNSTHATWEEVAPNGHPAPECLSSEASRPNHLGLIGHKKQWTYNWKVPATLLEGEDERACVFRLRYNITEDYKGSATNPTTGAFDTVAPGEMTAQYNSKQPANADNTPSTWPLWRQYGITDAEVRFNLTGDGTIENVNDNNDYESRDYVLRNNPQVQVIPDVGDTKLRLQLAINTAQYGRTFQDRTHVTTISKRPDDIPADANIKLITVQGKRGNIVQVFPGTEYFYVPDTLHAKADKDYVHWMWSGSDTNPNNNDGQGKQGTDRSNAVPLRDRNYVANAAEKTEDGGTFSADGTLEYGSAKNNYPAFVAKPKGYVLPNIEDISATGCRAADHVVTGNMGGIAQDKLEALATGRQHTESSTDYGNMEELDDEGTSVNIMTKVTQTGCWNYMGSRNNNFSNRSQKGKLCVDDGEYEQEDIGPNGKAVMSDGGWVMVPSGALTSIQQFTFSTTGTEEVGDEVLLEPEDIPLVEGERIQLGIDYEHRALRKPMLMHKCLDCGSWNEVSENVEFKKSNGKNVCVAWVTTGGYYQVQDKTDAGAVAAIVCAALVFFGIISFMIWWRFWRAPEEGKKDAFGDLQA